jgi:hypothetical protein
MLYTHPVKLGKLTLTLLGSELGEEVGVALVGSTGSVPEKDPLEGLATLKVVLEPELVFLVRDLQEIEELSGGLVNREWRTLVVVDQDRNSSIGVYLQEIYGAQVSTCSTRRDLINQGAVKVATRFHVEEYDHDGKYSKPKYSRKKRGEGKKLWLFLQSFFCSLVPMLMRVVVHFVP